MSAPACAVCGTVHGPAQRYCLTCGRLVGRRSIEIDQAIAYRQDRHSPAPFAAGSPAAAPSSAPSVPPEPAAAISVPPEPTAAPASAVGVWRRPATSIATAVALAAGLTVGFLTAPQGGVAESGAPVALSTPSGTTTAPSPDDAAPAPEDATSVPAETAPDDSASADDAPADAPAPPDDASALPAADPAPAASSTVDEPPATPAPTTKATPPSKATPKAKATTKAKPKKQATAARGGTAGTLPAVDHVWVIGTAGPLPTDEGGYVGDVLLARGTELPGYVPTSTDPLLGAAALVAGREPSANAGTIVRSLTAAKRTWRAYAPGAPSCTDAPTGIPLLSFPTVTATTDCADHVTGLDALVGDLDDPPSFSYVATDPALDPAGLDVQLRQVIEPIRRSAAFKRGGLIAVVPTAANPVAATSALILSPFAEGSTSVGTSYGPHALLRTFSELLGIDPVGQAAGEDVRPLDADVLAPKD